MIDWWRRRKYRQNTYGIYRLIMSAGIGPRGADLAFKNAFFDRRKALEAGYDTQEPPITTSLTIVAIALGRGLDAVPQNQRELALLAIKAGNTANAVANHIIAIVDMARLLSRGQHKEAVMAILYEALGALEGYDSTQRAQYRAARMLDDAINNRHQ